VHLGLDVFAYGLELDLGLVDEVDFFLKKYSEFLNQTFLRLHIVDHLDTLRINSFLRIQQIDLFQIVFQLRENSHHICLFVSTNLELDLRLKFF